MIIGINANPANRPHKTGTEWYAYYLIRHLAHIDNRNQYVLFADRPLIGGLRDLTLTEDQTMSQETNSGRTEFHNGYQVINSPHHNIKAKILRWPFSCFWTQGRLSLEMALARVDVLFLPADPLPIVHPRKSIVTIHDIAYERDRLLYLSEELGPSHRRSRILINVLVRFATLNRYGANTLDYMTWSNRFAM